LSALEAAGFLRRIALYPLVFQITKSTTRLLGSNSRARRRHANETVEARLLGVSFYLEVRGWPAPFVFDHGEKIDTFEGEGCPATALPQRRGAPYVRDQFVLCLPTGDIGVALADQAQRSPFLQLKRLLKDFAPAAQHLRERLQLIVAVASGSRERSYRRRPGHHDLQKLSARKLESWIRICRVRDHLHTAPTFITAQKITESHGNWEAHDFRERDEELISIVDDL
jgi:hypothetical protein